MEAHTGQSLEALTEEELAEELGLEAPDADAPEVEPLTEEELNAELAL